MFTKFQRDYIRKPIDLQHTPFKLGDHAYDNDPCP